MYIVCIVLLGSLILILCTTTTEMIIMEASTSDEGKRGHLVYTVRICNKLIKYGHFKGLQITSTQLQLSQAVTDSRDEMTKNSLVTIVVILAGVIVLLLLLMLGCCAFLFSFAYYKRHKQSSLITHNTKYYYDMLMRLSPHEGRNSMPICVNSSYISRHHQDELPDVPPTNIYSEVKDGSEFDSFDTNSGDYDDTCEDPYTVIPEQNHAGAVVDAAGEEGATRYYNESPSTELPAQSNKVPPSIAENKRFYETV